MKLLCKNNINLIKNQNILLFILQTIAIIEPNKNTNIGKNSSWIFNFKDRVAKKITIGAKI